MDPPDLQPRGFTEAEGAGDGSGTDWLEEIIDRLDGDPEETRAAMETLSTVDEVTRSQVIEALGPYRDRPGVGELLRLLEATPTPTVPAVRTGPERRDLGQGIGQPCSRIRRSLVTPLDGEGRGTIVISAIDGGYRRTAAFRCDVRRGIFDVVGEVEEEHPSAGSMIDEWAQRAESGDAVNSAELAVRLLEGCRILSGPQVPESVRTWLEATIGPLGLPTGMAATLPGPESEVLSDRELLACAESRPRRLPGLAGPLSAHLRTGRRDLLAGGLRGARPRPRRRGLSLPVRASSDRPTRALRPDAPVDGMALARQRPIRAIAIGLRPGRATLGRAVRRPLSPLHRRLDDAQPPRPGRSGESELPLPPLPCWSGWAWGVSSSTAAGI